ncbi:MAG TPA: 50S ribosomal protein L25 [Gemmataceae bacterium]|nr:50S ribosomal protein L25 [Gemmataceae bacterium]
MAESVALVTQPREGRGSQSARRLRRKGMIPAVIYGHKEETVSVALPLEELERAIRHGVRVVDLKSNGKEEKALIREVQWDHLGKELLHVDFARVALDERIVVTVPLEIRGVAPGVNAGGTLDQPIHTLSVECLAIRIPESIRVNVGELQIGSVIHVRDLVLPEGVKAMTDPDAIVVHITMKQVEAEAPVAAAAPEQAEPEVIGRQKAEEEEGEQPAGKGRG